MLSVRLLAPSGVSPVKRVVGRASQRIDVPVVGILAIYVAIRNIANT
jgi:hypothetical protein